MTVCHRLYDQYSPLLIFVALLTHKVRRCASQVQCWAFLASKPNALNKLFDVACLSYDTVTESQELMSWQQLWKKSVSFYRLEF